MFSELSSTCYQIRKVETWNKDLGSRFEKDSPLRRQQEVRRLQRFISIKLKNRDGLICHRLDA